MAIDDDFLKSLPPNNRQYLIEKEARIRKLWQALRMKESRETADSLLIERDPGFGGSIHMAYRALHCSFKMYRYQEMLLARLKFLVGMSPSATEESKGESVALFENFPDAMPPGEYSFFGGSANSNQAAQLVLEHIKRKDDWATACSALLGQIEMSVLFSSIVMDALRRHFDLTRNEPEKWTDDARSILAADSLTGNVLRAILTLETDMPDQSLSEAEALIMSVYGLR